MRDESRSTARKVESAGFVLVHDGRVLLLRNRDRREWGLPKGHREDGETLDATARRELEEETGIRELEVDPAFRRELSYPVVDGKRGAATKTATYFLGRVKSADVTLSKEHDQRRWATAAEADALLSHEHLRALVRDALAAAARP